MYLAACQKQAGHAVKIIDTRLSLMRPETLARTARTFSPDIIGISALLLEARNFHENAAALRAAFPKAPIIGGGPYASSCPEHMLKDENITCAVPGEGEIKFQDLVSRLESNIDFNDVEGLAVRENGAVRLTPQRSYIADLDTLPFPEWDSIDIKAYYRTNRFSNMPPGPYMAIFTSRSCPYQCIYCHKIFGKAFRARTPENVIQEFRTIVNRYNIRDFEIMDDCFNFDADRAALICDLIRDANLGIKLSFPNGVRADRLDDALIRKIKDAGTQYMAIAVETGVPRVQKLIRKNLDLAKVKHVIRFATRAGIFCHGFFMLGFPTETADEMRQTVRYATQSRLHTAAFFIAKPVPGTPMHTMTFGADQPHISEEFQDYCYTSMDLQSSDLSAVAIQNIYHSAYFRFYLNPFRVFRILLAFPHKSFLFFSFVHLLARFMRSPRVKSRK